jgi:putative ABC transport system substrate-binding protein
MVHDPGDPISVLELNTYRKTLTGTSVEMRVFEVHHARDFAKAFIAIKAYRPQALIYPTLVLPAEKLEQTVRFAERIRLATLTEGAQFAEAGILLSYGVDYLDAYKRAAVQVDKLLKGRKTSDLPWEQADKFELVLNMKTARAIGLTIPESIMAQATRIIK